ncbi:MAG: methionyl-tRNA formyltransferase [Lachnospiraceae bacterium]|nr:methionyl-tRNA formyltransferase [Lachnospiraceae bacterium]MCI8826483.1 methionyl-tRNA formyltransferase [Lachnospiraceae bacterium]MCI9371077.1 methionyl-tRNA formyltransferase [Lachnospiraceae bacterium]
MKIIFMGTPEFAAYIMEAVANAGHDIALAVTQCDKPRGRGKKVQFSPVKEKAVALGIPVYQPEKIKKEECVRELLKYEPEMIIVAAYGQILPESILTMAKHGCINVHGSLLPKYRGAAPIQWAIIDGEKETGVTTMKMDAGIDTGDMIDKTVVSIAKEETTQTLYDKLMRAGASLLLETMEKLEKGTAVFTKQNEDDSTYAKILKKEMGNIDFSMPAEKIERLIRGLNPWPAAYTSYQGRTLKIWKAFVKEEQAEGEFGEIIEVAKDSFSVKTGKNLLCVTELQMEGKKRMDTRAFLSGIRLETGERLGN